MEDRLSRTCVVIPTYNESQNIGPLIAALRRLSPRLSIIVVDDHSPDGTGEIVDKMVGRLGPLQIIHRRGKAGRGSACLEGFKRALQDPEVRSIVEMDADFSHDPNELPEMIAALDRADAIIRSRYKPGSSIVNWSPARRIFSKIANWVARTCLGIPLTDYTNGYRAYIREALSALDHQGIDSSGYIMLSEVALQLHQRGFRLAEMPTTFVNRRRGESNLTLKEISSAVWGILRLALRTRRLCRTTKQTAAKKKEQPGH